MRLLVRVGLAVAVNAVALLIAAAVLDDFRIDAGGFVFALIVFSLASLIVRPVGAWMVTRWVQTLTRVVALITTFVVLLVTDLLSDGVQIEGALTWLLATVIVWLATVVYSIFDRRLQRGVMRRLRPGSGPAA